MDIAKTVALTAVGGLVVGLGACGGSDTKGSDTPAATGSEAAPPAGSSGAKTCCKGLNDCSKKGGCKTDANACKGLNDCKHKGGCSHRDCG